MNARLKRLFPAAFLTVLLAAGCAPTTPRPTAEIPPLHTIAEFQDQRFAEVYDPWEKFNRNMYRFNFYLDKYLLLPVVRGYEFITPVFVQDRISNFYNNLGEIRNLYNSAFQAKGKQSLKTLGRFVTNSTIGIGGLFDPATPLGLKRHEEDFGQTLGYWGVDSGPYLVLPAYGPSSARDTGGLAVDSAIFYGIYSAIDPFEDTGDSTAISAGITALGAIDTRHQQKFRYYESGYPFEYYIVRFFYHQKRDLDAGRSTEEEAPAAPAEPTQQAPEKGSSVTPEAGTPALPEVPPLPP